ncbi:glycoside hydrolase family 105 protein [Periconia macrospinosa]|uniref:Glycoside hydrolase family 105 protein n=1 Tax=Periconia macrospinosa TaxID=97972 RepID=A0A2V1DQR2_9PLEO|nr:glycoside hydrolase family 105 protein [Periconia macrospinosa]
MSRGQGILSGTGDVSELLQAGFTQKTFRKWLDEYPDDIHASAIASYLERSASSVITTVSNATRSVTSSALDRLSNGNSLINLYQKTGNDTYRTAFEALRTSINLQPRNSENGLWYYVYPNWSYLDGMESLAPFYTLYTTTFDAENTTAVPDDMIHQIDLLWKHCYVKSSGLLVHGYDSSRTAVWANNVTGASPHVWGRSLGWFAMSLVDTIELLPTTQKYIHARQHLTKLYCDLAAAVAKAVDAKSGAWWQILDQPGRPGNYIESSGSAMFAYALMKGARLGYTTPEPSRHVAKRAYEYLVDAFVVNNGNGTLGYNGTVAVCSLNSTATYEYYVGRPILYNSVLGTAAFMLASLEYESLQK